MVKDRRLKVVRNGRVLSAGSLNAAPLDLLIEDGRIRQSRRARRAYESLLRC
jgi:hypothetical protein